MTSDTPQALNMRGIVFAVGAAIAFSVNDMSIKFLSGDYPLHQIVFVRAALALVLTLGLVMPFDGGWAGLRTRRPFVHIARGLCVVVANITFFSAIAVLPLADAVAAFFIAPILITGFSALLLGEKVGPRRWIAVVVGLLGVIIVVRPGAASFSALMLLPVASATAYALMQIMTRSMGLSERASTMALYIQATFLVIAGGVGLVLGDGKFAGSDNPAIDFLTRAWVMPGLGDALIMSLIACMSAVGGLLISLAYRRADAALVAPFEYVALLMSIFWGFAIFGTLPAGGTWIGIALIIAAGVFIAVREAGADLVPSLKRVAGRR